MIKSDHTFPNTRYISCASNPFDLRPARDAIVSETLLRRLESPKDKPLVLLMPELHTMPAYVALRQMVTAGLNVAENKSPAFGYEADHSAFEQYILPHLKPDLDDAARSCVAKNDRDGRCLVAGMILNNPYSEARSTNNSFFSLCHRDNLSVRFNDAATMNFPPDFDVEMQIDNPEGWAMRNRIIVDRALAHIDDTQAPVYIQNCGISHVLGKKSAGYRFEHSLTAYFEKAGAVVLSPYITHDRFDKNDIPEEALPVLRRNLTIAGIASNRYSKLWSDSGEEDFQDHIHRMTKGEYEIVSINPGKVRQDFEAAIKACLTMPFPRSSISLPDLATV